MLRVSVPLSVIWGGCSHPPTPPPVLRVLPGQYQPVEAAPRAASERTLLPPRWGHRVTSWCQFNSASYATCVLDLISLWNPETNVFKSSMKITPKIQLSSNIRSLATLPTAECDVLSRGHGTSAVFVLENSQKWWWIVTQWVFSAYEGSLF